MLLGTPGKITRGRESGASARALRKKEEEMANLFWKTSEGTKRLVDTPFKTEDVAIAVWLGQTANIALLAGFVWYIDRFQIRPEERALSTLFGAEYAAYCARVRRWL